MKIPKARELRNFSIFLIIISELGVKMKIFIINLERSKDRRQVMQERIDILFAKYPSLKDKLEFIFFQAVDGGGG